MPSVHRQAVRLGLYYTAVFAVIGIHMPFWPIWLQAQGLRPSEIGIILGAAITAKIVGNPLAAHLADRSGERKRVMIILGITATAAFSLFTYAQGFWPLFTLTVVFLLLWGPIIPLGESIAMLSVERNGIDYGRVRLWGSASFIAAAVLTGWGLVGRSEDLLYFLILGMLAITTLTLFMIPDERTPKATGRAPLLGVLGQGRFVLFLAATALIQSSHAVYYGFATIHWRSAGYREDIIGWLWAEGVIAEILLFMAGTWLLARIGPVRLILLGGLAGMLRWGIAGATDTLSALLFVQILHAFTFGAAHLGAIHFISRAVPPALSATAQSIYSAVVMGLALGFMTFVSGELYAVLAGQAFLAMAGLSLAGTVLALFLERIDDQGSEK